VEQSADVRLEAAVAPQALANEGKEGLDGDDNGNKKSKKVTISAKLPDNETLQVKEVKKCKDPKKHWDDQTKKCVANSENMKNHKNKGGFANIEEADFKMGGTPTMNYKDTVKNAYNNLEDLLGSDGVKEMTLDTEKLTQQQDKLLEAMNKMEPMMKMAENMMGTLKGFDLGNLMGGTNNQ
jgi:hypothetical protein